MKRIKSDNFWYAVNNTEIVVMPSSYLDTFGATNLRYRLISELMDSVDRIRVREGTIEAFRPKIITPAHYENEILDGFGDAAHKYVDWLRSHAKDLYIIQYGFKLQQKGLSEHIVSGKFEEVVENVKRQVSQAANPTDAVVRGVDDLWDVCLLKLMVDMARNSAPANFNDLHKRRLLENVDGVPRAIREEIEKSFAEAARDPSRAGALYERLRRDGLFEEYEDRFFALVRRD